jgi:hypothetical protein
MNTLYIVKIQEGLLDYLITILTPHIFEGISSIYKEAKAISQPVDVLKNFQIFVGDIKNWNGEMISNETKRILLEINLDNDSLLNTIKTILKYTMHIYNMGENTISIEYENIKLEEFIHNIYKTIGNQLYSNPFLMYDNINANDIKQNHQIINNLINRIIKEKIYKYLPIKDITLGLLNLDLTILKGGNNTESTKLLTDSINMSDNLRNIINQEIHKIKNDLPLNSDKNILPVIVPQLNQAQLEQPNNVPEIKPTQQGGEQGAEHERKSPENVINNDKIEVNESKKEIKLSSSENIKAVENEINKLNNKSEKSPTDLIRKLDHDRNESTYKGGKHNHSSTSSDYDVGTDNIAVYSNSNTSNKSGVFLQKDNLKKTIPKYENIKI